MSEVLTQPWARGAMAGEEAPCSCSWRSETPQDHVDAGPRPYDRMLLMLVLAAIAVGVVMVYSASLVRAGIPDDFFKTGLLTGRAEHYLVRMLVNAGLGLVALLVAMKVPLGWYRRHAYGLLGLSIFLLVGLLVFGHTANNSTRWYDLKLFRFQPTEMAKLALIIYLAFSLVKKAERIRSFTFGFVPSLVVALILIGLCLKQPDFGTSLTMLGIMLAMLYVGGTRLKYLLGVAACGVPLLYVAVKMSPMRVSRMSVFLDPWEHCSNSGYHLCESLIGVASGGFWGEGLGEGRMKLFFLPEAHTDFIMAILIEELGFAGLLGVVLLFALLAWRGLRISCRASSPFARFLAFGITLQLVGQAAVNMGVVTGVLPTKGLTLPFISYGGSSMLFSCIMAGILLRISMALPESEEERAPVQDRLTYGVGRLTRLRLRLWRAIA